jgi:hypothetical protein
MITPDKPFVLTKPAPELPGILYATDEWRRGPLGYERQWTQDKTHAKAFTAEEAARAVEWEERKVPR